MNADNIAQRIRSLQYSKEDLEKVVQALKACDDAFLSDIVYSYIKFVSDIDTQALLDYIGRSRAPYPVSQIITGLSLRKVVEKRFIEKVVEFSKGVSWDDQDLLLLPALLVLPMVVPCDNRIKDVLRNAYRSDNPVIRDAALTAAQLYLGIPPPEVRWGRRDRDMSDVVPKEIVNWLS